MKLKSEFFQFKIVCLIVNEYIRFFLMISHMPTGTSEIGALGMDGTGVMFAYKSSRE